MIKHFIMTHKIVKHVKQSELHWRVVINTVTGIMQSKCSEISKEQQQRKDIKSLSYKIQRPSNLFSVCFSFFTFITSGKFCVSD